MDLREPGELPLPQRVLDQLLARVGVSVLLLLGDGECAELALHAADVRLVQIEVLDEVDVVGTAAKAARRVSQLAEGEDVVGLHQRQAVLEVEPLAGLDLLGDEFQAADCDGHQT
jgi:hypothetical protein